MKRYSNNLHTFLSDRQTIHLEDKVKLAFQSSIALNSLNSLHGRLKPSNVFVDYFGEKQTPNSRIKVAIGDYGFPRWNVDSQKLEDFVLLAPERFSFQETERTIMNEKSDVYRFVLVTHPLIVVSFGWLLYEIIVEESVPQALQKYLASFFQKFPADSQYLNVDNQVVSITSTTSEYLSFLTAIKKGWRPQLPQYAVNSSGQIGMHVSYSIS